MILHASCVALEGKAVLIVGPAGVGKSDLALRLIDEGAQLISDDQTFLQTVGDQLIATPPDAIAGLFEVRHWGLIRMPWLTAATVKLYVELKAIDFKLERLPEAESILLLDQLIPRLSLPGLASSTPAKIRAALRYPLVTDAV